MSTIEERSHETLGGGQERGFERLGGYQEEARKEVRRGYEGLEGAQDSYQGNDRRARQGLYLGIGQGTNSLIVNDLRLNIKMKIEHFCVKMSQNRFFFCIICMSRFSRFRTFSR